MWKLIDNMNEKHENNFFVLLLKLLYKLGKNAIINSILIIVLSIFIPITYQYEEKRIFVLLLIFLVLYLIFYHICIGYEKYSKHRRARFFRALEIHSETISSIACLVADDNNWQENFFAPTAEIVCGEIQRFFRNEFDIKTRISVEYVFKKQDLENEEEFIKMVGRQSSERQNGHRTRKISKKKQYYVYKIFESNNKGLHRLSVDQIKNKNLWYKNHDIDIKEYWGIAVASSDNRILFVLQIDFIDSINLKDNEIPNFIDDYLKLFVQTLRLAFLQDNSIIN